MLQCSNGSYYTGYTTDIKKRYLEHCDGSSKCKYTRSFPPIGIAASWQIDCDLSTILKIEAHIKNLSRSEKDSLVAQPTQLPTLISATIRDDVMIEALLNPIEPDQ